MEDILSIAETGGFLATRSVYRDRTDEGHCYNFSPGKILTRVIEVLRWISTPDGYILYLSRVVPVDGVFKGGRWFALHVDKVEAT